MRISGICKPTTTRPCGKKPQINFNYLPDRPLAALGSSGINGAQLNKAASRMLYDLTKVREQAWAKEYGQSGLVHRHGQ